MGTRAVVETGQDRKALVADAGFSRLSLASVAAGVLTAYGAFAVLAGLAAGILSAADVDIDVAASWRDLGVGGGLVVAALLLLAYLFGGYVAGRMARRAGALHRAVVFALGLVIVAGAAVITRAMGAADDATSTLRNFGVPTTASEWGDVASIAAVASLAGMLIGALAGGALGERWHTKLLARALDPHVGAEAEARAEAERLAAEAEERRTEAIQRVRTTAPTRTARVDSGLGDDDARQHSGGDQAHVMHPANGPVLPDADGPRAGDDDRTERVWWRIPKPGGSQRRTTTDPS